MKEKLRTRVKEQAEQEVTRKQELEAQAKARRVSDKHDTGLHTLCCTGSRIHVGVLHLLSVDTQSPSYGTCTALPICS